MRLGIQGVGVKTPLAAAVADAVVGLANEEHAPNGGTFPIGILSLIFAATFLSAVTPGMVTIKVEGAAPNVQLIDALSATNCAIVMLPFYLLMLHV